VSVVALWSMKGGVGVSVLTAALAVAANRAGPESRTPVLAVDLVGDLPVVLGMESAETLGVIDWLHASPDDPADALGRLSVRPSATAEPGLSVMPRGSGPIAVDDIAGSAVHFVDVLRSVAEISFVDCGHLRSPGPLTARGTAEESEATPEPAPVASADHQFRVAVAAAADVGWLATRTCYLSARVAPHTPVQPDGCVVLREAGRALAASDIAAVLGVPVVLDAAVDQQVARVVDCGLLITRLPASLQRTMVRSLRHVD